MSVKIKHKVDAESVIARLDTYHVGLRLRSLLFKRLIIGDSTTDGDWGIHPTPAGHQRIADLWISNAKKKKYIGCSAYHNNYR